jgi:sec-independent protein translocase protein TatA
MGLGTGEIILIFIVVMVIFGSTKLPQLGDGLGRAIKNFKRAVSSQNEIDVSAKKPELKKNASAVRDEDDQDDDDAAAGGQGKTKTNPA